MSMQDQIDAVERQGALMALLTEINERLIDLELTQLNFIAEPPGFEQQWEAARQRIKDRYK